MRLNIQATTSGDDRVVVSVNGEHAFTIRSSVDPYKAPSEEYVITEAITQWIQEIDDLRETVKRLQSRD